MPNVPLQADPICRDRIYITNQLKIRVMHLEKVDGRKQPNSSFITVWGRVLGENEDSEIIINVDSISYIKGLANDKILIVLAGVSVVTDYSYEKFSEWFLNDVNTLFHISKH